MPQGDARLSAAQAALDLAKRQVAAAKRALSRYGIDAILALGRAVVIIRTFEDEAEALGNESDLSGFSPAEKIEGNLTHAIILGHIVHCLTPPFKGASQRLLGMVAPTATLRAETLKSWILSVTNSIVEIKLGGKVPLAVICVLPPDIVRVEGEKRLVG